MHHLNTCLKSKIVTAFFLIHFHPNNGFWRTETGTDTSKWGRVVLNQNKRRLVHTICCLNLGQFYSTSATENENCIILVNQGLSLDINKTFPSEITGPWHQSTTPLPWICLLNGDAVYIIWKEEKIWAKNKERAENLQRCQRTIASTHSNCNLEATSNFYQDTQPL